MGSLCFFRLLIIPEEMVIRRNGKKFHEYWQKLENSALKQVWNCLLFIPEEMVIRRNGKQLRILY